jgi:cobaltochelatase CobN
VDITLRISGLFRDAFESQMRIFDLAVQSLAARDEPENFNPLAQAARGLKGAERRAATTRIYGAAPGTYGAGVPAQNHAGGRAALGDAYLAASAYAYGEMLDGVLDVPGFAARVAGASAFVHQQDSAEIDIFDGLDFAAFEGGFAAAAEKLGGAPALYHADTSRQDAPRLRLLHEEIARIVRGKAANPAWIAGMMRHDYRGAAEISRALDGFCAFAASLAQNFDQQFDLIFEATCGNPEVDAFLRNANPDARRTMLERFRNARAQNIWRSRRNSIAEFLDQAA